jgi:hypothetical protein
MLFEGYLGFHFQIGVIITIQRNIMEMITNFSYIFKVEEYVLHCELISTQGQSYDYVTTIIRKFSMPFFN